MIRSKAKKRKNQTERDMLKNDTFWGTYELFMTSLVYILITEEEMDRERVKRIVEGIAVFIGDVHSKRDTLDELKIYVSQETGIPVQKMFGKEYM